MKKLFSIVLALVLALSLSVTAFAASGEGGAGTDTTTEDTIIEPDAENNYEPNGTGTTKVKYEVKPTYSVTIPESMTVDFHASSTDFGIIKLKAARINLGYAVKVALNASGTLKNKADASKTIPYTIRDKAADEAFSSREYQTVGDSTALTIDITGEAWDAAYGGNYSDTVTFTISYEAVTP